MDSKEFLTIGIDFLLILNPIFHYSITPYATCPPSRAAQARRAGPSEQTKVAKEDAIVKIILTQDVHELGLEGDTVNVANGHARNYLIPKGIALEANEQNMKLMETKRKKIEVNRLEAKDEAEKIKEKISDVEITISQKVGEEDKLYGSVTTMDIASELEKQGITIDRRKIVLDKPIKTLGEYDVPIKLYPEVTGSIKLVVIAEEQT
jgi:large subunit ribosomal protein L9